MKPSDHEARWYRDAWDQSPEMLASIDPATGLILDCNELLARTIGTPQGLLVGRPAMDLYHPSSRAAAREAFREFVDHGSVGRTRLSLATREGNPIEIDLRVASVRDENGKIVRSISCLTEVSPGPAAGNGRVLGFGPFELDCRTLELRRGGESIHLQQQPARLLAFLVDRPGQLVSRDEIRTSVWDEETYVEFDQALNFAVRQIRRALDDHSDRPQYIETLPRRGYRFVAPVTEAGPAPDEPKRALGRRSAVVLVAVILAAALGIATLFDWPARKSDSVDSPVKTYRLTSLLHSEDQPALSPDGSRIAFISDGEESSISDVYVGEIDPDSKRILGVPFRLTSASVAHCCPTWSPKGQRLAYMRLAGEKAVVSCRAASGGPRMDLASATVWFGSGLSWSRDGLRVVFSDRPAPGRPFALVSVHTKTREREQLTTPGENAIGDGLPAFSPDGRHLAFLRSFARGGRLEASAVFVSSSDGSSPRRITSDESFVAGLAWTSDSRSIFYSSNRGGEIALWKVGLRGGAPRRVDVSPDWGGSQHAPAAVLRASDLFRISTTGQKLVFAEGRFDKNIFQFSPTREEVVVYSSTVDDSTPHFSPDGKSVVLSSSRSGHTEIWTCDILSAVCVQLTRLAGHSSAPRFSPNGFAIAFETRLADQFDIYDMAPIAGHPTRLTFDDADDVLPSWSSDAAWIYFGSRRSGSWEIWKMPASGGEAERVTQNGGLRALASRDGRWLYYSKFNQHGIWRRPTEGTSERVVVSDVSCWGYWDLSDDGIHYLYGPGGHGSSIHFYDFETGETSPTVTLKRAPACGEPGMSVSPDGETLLLTQLELGGRDLILAEGVG